MNKKIDFLDIWLIELGEDGNNIYKHEQFGKRPFVVISQNSYHENSKTPIGFIMTTSDAKKNSKYTLTIQLPNQPESAINTSQIKTLSQDRFISKLGKLNELDFKKLMEIFFKQIIGGDSIKIDVNLNSILANHFKK